MTKNTVLLLLLSLVIAFTVAAYHYLYKVKMKSKTSYILAFLRFISIFGLLLLLINPIITVKKYEIVKTPLPIIIDNSSSIKNLNAEKSARDLFNALSSNKSLLEKYDVQLYQFDADFFPAEQINFKGKQSNIDLAAKNLKSIYKNQFYPSILITDGNQTSGEDYVFKFNPENKVYPLVLGDTATFLDIRVSRLNVNKYAFHKNKFPVEVFLN